MSAPRRCVHRCPRLISPSLCALTRRTVPLHPFGTLSLSTFSSSSSSSSSSSCASVPPLSLAPSIALTSKSSPCFREGQLTRDFIAASLYDSEKGYFNRETRIASPTAGNALEHKVDVRFLAGGAFAPLPLALSDTSSASLSLPLSDEPVVHKPKEDIKLNFASMNAREGYYKQLTQLYGQLQRSWLTPVEIFHPYYAQAIARWIVEQVSADEAYNAMKIPLRIIEVGGGNGTLAMGILDYLQHHCSHLYACTHYSILDLSPLHKTRQTVLLSAHQEHIELLTMSALDWDRKCEDPVFVIGLEVLDNMPHDKIMIEDECAHQTRVVRSPHGDRVPYDEVYETVNDAWIEECLSVYEEHSFNEIAQKRTRQHDYGNWSNKFAISLARKIQNIKNWLHMRLHRSYLYLPTTALHFFHVLHHFLPQHRLLLADFSELPSTTVGLNGPIVSGSDQFGKVHDYDTYLQGLGAADIFFPTDFEFISALYQSSRAKRAAREHRDVSTLRQPIIRTNYEFMKVFAIDAAKKEWEAANRTEGKQDGRRAVPWRSPTKTTSSFDPILHDYANFMFLTV